MRIYGVVNTGFGAPVDESAVVLKDVPTGGATTGLLAKIVASNGNTRVLSE